MRDHAAVLLLHLASFAAIGGCEPRRGLDAAQVAPPQASANGSIAATGSMSVARASHTATLLPDGKVLIVGGMGVAGASAELFDPKLGSFTKNGDTRFVHEGGHSAVTLASGKILLAGGWSGSTIHANAELYDPRTSSFSPTASMNARRSGYTATTLTDGRVLIAGGFDGSSRLRTTEIYDPRTGVFAPAGSMAEPRVDHVATLLANGQVLITGGNRGQRDVLGSAEIFDPRTASFRTAGKMTQIRHKHAAVLLRDGRVLVMGGSDARDGRGRYSSAEIYDHNTGRFSAIAEMNAKRFKFATSVIVLASGKVLVAGGSEHAEVYDPASGTFGIVKGSMGAGRSFPTLTVLRDGRVLVVGGYDSRIVSTAEAWLYTARR